MISTKQLLPKVYFDSSYDFRVFCGLLDLVLADMFYIVDGIQYNRDPLNCLDRYIGKYTADYLQHVNQNLSTDQLRIILNDFWNLVHKRGTLSGINAAVSLCVKYFYPTYSYLITLSEDEQTILISLLGTKGDLPFDLNMLQYTLEMVRPVGVVINSVIVTDKYKAESTLSTFISSNYRKSTSEEQAKLVKSSLSKFKSMSSGEVLSELNP